MPNLGFGSTASHGWLNLNNVRQVPRRSTTRVRNETAVFEITDGSLLIFESAIEIPLEERTDWSKCITLTRGLCHQPVNNLSRCPVVPITFGTLNR